MPTFVSPSRFLAERYVKWGIDEDKLRVSKTDRPWKQLRPPRELQGPNPRRNRFAYFGQMTPFKGLDVLIDAVSRIPKEIWGDNSCLMIFGGNLERQPDRIPGTDSKKLIARSRPPRPILRRLPERRTCHA